MPESHRLPASSCREGSCRREVLRLVTATLTGRIAAEAHGGHALDQAAAIHISPLVNAAEPDDAVRRLACTNREPGARLLRIGGRDPGPGTAMQLAAEEGV